MKSISNKFIASLSDTESNTVVDLWEVNLEKIKGRSGKYGSVLRFHNGLSEFQTPILWKGQEYEPYPIQAEGFELSAQGTSNRPKLHISNLLGLVYAISEEYDQCVGARVTRKQTLVKYLDDVNFVMGNPNSDPTQEATSIYIVESLSQLTHETAIFELALPSETDNALLPGRSMAQIEWERTQQ